MGPILSSHPVFSHLNEDNEITAWQYLWILKKMETSVKKEIIQHFLWINLYLKCSLAYNMLMLSLLFHAEDVWGETNEALLTTLSKKDLK